MGRFFAYLLLFQGSMVGIVLSDNILLLIVFWELTSLTSFLLIGYWYHLPESRAGARMALVVTGGGGLALMGGMLLLGNIAGSFELSEILTRGDVIKASPLYLPMLLLILLGAFTQVGAVSVPLLAAACDGRADAGVGLSAFRDHGEGGRVPDGAAVAGARPARRNGS